MRSSEWRGLALRRSRAAPAALESTRQERDHRLEERERVGGLQHVGLGPAALLVHPHERLDLLASAGSAPCSRSQAATICAQRSWCQRLYSGSSQSRAESQPRCAVRVRALDVVGDGGDLQRLGRPGSSSSTQSSVRCRWRACGCTSAIQAVARSTRSAWLMPSPAGTAARRARRPRCAHSMSCGPPRRSSSSHAELGQAAQVRRHPWSVAHPPRR